MYLSSQLYCPEWRPSACPGVRGEHRSWSRRFRRGGGVQCCPARPNLSPGHRSPDTPYNDYDYIDYYHDNTVHGALDYGGMNCHVKGNTYNIVLTVPVVSTGVALSGCPHIGERLPGTREGVHKNTWTSHHHLVLEFYGASIAGNEDDNNSQ